MRGVIYARYSSDNQREESIEGQLRECKEYAEKNDIQIIGTYTDRALSAKTDNRPDFQKMIEDSADKKFGIVLVWKLDRFARNRFDSAYYKNVLRRNGVKVLSATELISQNAEGILLESMLEGYAEYYSAELSEKVLRGLAENALKCKYNGGTLPIGYYIDSNQFFQIDPITAPVVLAAFKSYAEGASMREVTDEMNIKGIRTKLGGKISVNSVTRMLHNRKYIGEYKYRDIVQPNGIPAMMQHLQLLRKDGKSFYETLKENINDPVFRKSGAAEFVEMIENLRQSQEDSMLSDCVEEICAQSGYEKYIRELGDMERFENLSEFKRIAFEYENNFGEKVTLKEFINQISLQSEDNGETDCDMVKLMTIHSAKGLEFPFVFVIGFSEGIFPSSKTIEERKEYGLEEERRLCYVAITRAEKRLFLLDSEGYTQNGKEKLPSRFLKEIGEENYVRVGTISKELQESADEYAASLCGEPIQKNIKEIGDTVTHPAFGEGKIIGYGKNKNSYRIKFDKLSSERDISADYFNKPRNLPVIRHNISTEEAKTEPPKAEPETPDGYKKVEETKVPEYKGTSSSQPQPEQKAQAPDLSEYENLWKRDDVPKTGWVCLGVIDLGAPVGVCEMCGHQIIRYVHRMHHPDYGTLGVGCICAGKMEGNPERAKQREQDFKNKESRKENFRNRKWKTSKNNNSYIKIKDHLIVLYYNKNYNNWKYSIDNEFCKEVFETRDEAMDAAFEALEMLLAK